MEKQLLELVQKSFPNCDRLDNWKILSGGALNTTYQFQIGSSAFVLKLYPRDRSHYKEEFSIPFRLKKGLNCLGLFLLNDYFLNNTLFASRI